MYKDLRQKFLDYVKRCIVIRVCWHHCVNLTKTLRSQHLPVQSLKNNTKTG